MGIWNLKKVISLVSSVCGDGEREAENLSGWIWEEIMGFSKSVEREFTQQDEERLNHVIFRLTKGEPIQYIAGHAWFYGLKLTVTPDVLIPRPETEELVHWILSDFKNRPGNQIRILDIGTGSGCIAIALKKHLRDKVILVAMDISPQALEIAKENALRNEVEIQFVLQDFLEEGINDPQMFDVIVSNPPYVSRNLINEEIISRLEFEPEIALFPINDDPDIFYRKLASVGMQSLNPGGACYVEMNEYRAEQIESYFRKMDWQSIESRIDLQGAKRMLKAVTGNW